MNDPLGWLTVALFVAGLSAFCVSLLNGPRERFMAGGFNARRFAVEWLKGVFWISLALAGVALAGLGGALLRGAG